MFQYEEGKEGSGWWEQADVFLLKATNVCGWKKKKVVL